MENSSLQELIKKNISDPKVYDQINQTLVSKTRKTALLLGSVLVIALIAIVYGYVNNVNAEKTKLEFASMSELMEAEKSEYEKQVALAVESKIIAEEAAKVAYEELEECRKKK